MGNLLGIVVHAANIHDTKSGILAAQKACKKYPSIQAFCADAGYRGTCIDEVKVTPHNSAARRAMSFPQPPPHLCGVILNMAIYSAVDAV